MAKTKADSVKERFDKNRARQRKEAKRSSDAKSKAKARTVNRQRKASGMKGGSVG